jgi:hypothetical protein
MEPATTLQLQLNTDQVNVILRALADLPFKEVYELIGEIHAQAQQQLAGEADQADVKFKLVK